LQDALVSLQAFFQVIVQIVPAQFIAELGNEQEFHACHIDEVLQALGSDRVLVD